MTTEVQADPGIDSLELCFDLAAKNIVLGAKIAKDGVGVEDMIHAQEAFNNIQELVKFIASKPDLAEEIKNLDIAEGFILLQKGYAKFKEVKAEVE
jgi:hypothetical protein